MLLAPFVTAFLLFKIVFSLHINHTSMSIDKSKVRITSFTTFSKPKQSREIEKTSVCLGWLEYERQNQSFDLFSQPPVTTY